jgi:signal peptidase I
MPQRPTRAIAILLAALVGCGVGHCYAGLQRRAFGWLGGMALLIFAFAALLLPLGSVIGIFPALVVWASIGFASWFGPIIDLAMVSEKRFAPTPAWKVLAFAIAFGAVALATPILIRITLLEAFKVPAGSMLPTLAVGDHMFVDKAHYRVRAPARGDVAVFQFPERPEQDFVKRVMAAPGDVLEVKAGHPWLNGWEVPHCPVGRVTMAGSAGEQYSGVLEVEFLQGKAWLTFYDDSAAMQQNQGPFVAASGEYWVLGDNRHNSHDSRFWFGGAGHGVPRKMFRGRAAVIWMSFRGASVDWSRAGQPLDRPVLPAEASALQKDLQRCLDARPSIDKTIPPPAAR